MPRTNRDRQVSGISDQLWEAIKARAADNEETASAYIRRLVENDLTELTLQQSKAAAQWATEQGWKP